MSGDGCAMSTEYHGRIDVTAHALCLDSECGVAWLIRREDQWRQRVVDAERLDPKLRSAMGEVVASTTEEVRPGVYECRMCDADISTAPFVHKPDCEAQFVDDHFGLTMASKYRAKVPA